MTTVYFIRHAESYGNLMRRAYGWHNGRVTPKGREQISHLEKRFSDVHIDAVYSSDLIRACTTAEAIYKTKGLKLYTKKELREIHLGIWEDMPWGQIATAESREYSNWCEKPLELTIEAGENYAELYARMRDALDEIVSENRNKSVAIISHGAALRTLMHGLMNNGNLSGLEKCDWGDNTCVSKFITEDGESYEPVYINDNTHLKDMPGYGENMRWVKESSAGSVLGKNLYFVRAEYPRDKEKLRRYYSEAWESVFGDSIGNLRRVDAAVKHMLEDDAESIMFGIGAGGEVGVVMLDICEEAYPQAGHVSLVYLRESFRRLGYGMQLIGHAVSKYTKMGKKHISVRVAEKNKNAVDFYKRYGFYEVSREVEEGIRQIIMLLDI